MSDGSAENWEHRGHLRLVRQVQDFEFPMSSNPTFIPEAEPSRSVVDAADWMAVAAVALPEGVELHRRTASHVLGLLHDRLPGVDLRSERLRVGYYLIGESREDAEADSRQVVGQLLGLLGLGEGAVVEHVVRRRQEIASIDG